MSTKPGAVVVVFALLSHAAHPSQSLCTRAVCASTHRELARCLLGAAQLSEATLQLCTAPGSKWGLLTPLISSITRRHWHQVGANVAKFCRDTARLAVLDNDKKQTSILRSVAGWHEKQVGTERPRQQ